MPPRDASRSAERQGPLKPLHFLMLVSLSEAERHPYGLKKDLEAREPGRLRLGAGTLYRAIQQLLDAGLIAESERRPVRELDDERRTYYRLTTLGRQAAAAEARRLTALVGSSRVRKLAERGETA
jgi:DNA-binding PadR family transcriptional regulator